MKRIILAIGFRVNIISANLAMFSCAGVMLDEKKVKTIHANNPMIFLLSATSTVTCSVVYAQAELPMHPA